MLRERVKFFIRILCNFKGHIFIFNQYSSPQSIFHISEYTESIKRHVIKKGPLFLEAREKRRMIVILHSFFLVFRSPTCAVSSWKYISPAEIGREGAGIQKKMKNKIGVTLIKSLLLYGILYWLVRPTRYIFAMSCMGVKQKNAPSHSQQRITRITPFHLFLITLSDYTVVRPIYIPLFLPRTMISPFRSFLLIPRGIFGLCFGSQLKKNNKNTKNPDPRAAILFSHSSHHRDFFCAPSSLIYIWIHM